MKRDAGKQSRGLHLEPARGICLLYLTCPDQRTASAIARAVVTAGLAACANILPQMHSCYRWQGRIETAREAVLILKTRSRLAAACAARARALHPYTVPCVLELPVRRGHGPYLDWLRAATAAKPPAQATRLRRSPARKARTFSALSATRR